MEMSLLILLCSLAVLHHIQNAQAAPRSTAVAAPNTKSTAENSSVAAPKITATKAAFNKESTAVVISTASTKNGTGSATTKLSNATVTTASPRNNDNGSATTKWWNTTMTSAAPTSNSIELTPSATIGELTVRRSTTIVSAASATLKNTNVIDMIVGSVIVLTVFTLLTELLLDTEHKDLIKVK